MAKKCRTAGSDIAGYGAIATARHPNGYGSLIGVALGMRSAIGAYSAISLASQSQSLGLTNKPLPSETPPNPGMYPTGFHTLGNGESACLSGRSFTQRNANQRPVTACECYDNRTITEDVS
jgi:hypothetical protein